MASYWDRVLGKGFKSNNGDVPGYQQGKYSGGITVPTMVSGVSGVSGPTDEQIKGPAAYAARAVPDKLPEYDAMRSRMQNQLLASNQTAKQNVDRSYAAMGDVGSGSYQKALENNDATLQGQQAANELQIGGQESAAIRALKEKQNEMEFQSQEASNARAFGNIMAAKNFEMGNKNLEMTNKNFEFQQMVNNFEANSKLRQLDLTGYGLDQAASESAFNRELSQYQSGKQGGLFGAGGFLGTGL